MLDAVLRAVLLVYAGRTMTDTVILRAGLAVLAADDIQSSVAIEVKGSRVVGWEHVPESSLTEGERRTILTPGLVNAHTHLDLGALRGEVPADEGFTSWVSDLVAKRAELSPEAVAEGVRASAREALLTGTVSLLDIDSTGATEAALAVEGTPMPYCVLLREVLDGSPVGRSARTEAAVGLARASIDRGHGLSPHGTHTVGDELMAELGRLRAESLRQGRTVPIAVHWAETTEEIDWLLRGEGPFTSWLGPSPGVTGTERMARAGLLEGSLLVHGNHPEPGEAARLGAAGCTVVHCPGSHLFFRRERFPLEQYRAHGVNVALGTDSWASNQSLDMRREMRLARETLGVGAEEAWRMATEYGAAFVTDENVTGRIAPGVRAHFTAFEHSLAGENHDLEALRGSCLDVLTRGDPKIRGVWIAGVSVGPLNFPL
ncbi:MAG: cytosine/adenosine deaminase-related metal-dependent hydrolase [Planctomycetota bacterium]